MEVNYTINDNSTSRSSTGSTSSKNASTDSPTNPIIRRPRFSLSTNAYLGPAFNACLIPQNSENHLDFIDSPLLPYSRSLRSSDPPFMDSTQLHQLLHHRLSSLASSHGSSSSPLSPIENLKTPPSRSPPVFNTPVKAEEGVLVIDGILINGGNRARSSSDSGSLSSHNLYKTEICRSWEDLGTCRYGMKCQFAHGKEELRPTRNHKPKSEICKSFSTIGACVYGTKCRFVHQVPARPGPPNNEEEHPDDLLESHSAERISAERISAERIAHMIEKAAARDIADVVEKAAEVRSTWLPSKQMEEYITKVLLGPSTRKRLPVFVEICPE